MGDPGDLVRAVASLSDRLVVAGPTWFAARAAGPTAERGGRGTAGGSSPATRAAVLRSLVAELARLGDGVVPGQPPRAEPPVLGDHALGDQLRVLAAELAAAPGGDASDEAARRVRTALAAVRAARDLL